MTPKTPRRMQIALNGIPHFLLKRLASQNQHLASAPYKYPIQSGSIALNFLGSTATATRSTTV